MNRFHPVVLYGYSNENNAARVLQWRLEDEFPFGKQGKPSVLGYLSLWQGTLFFEDDFQGKWL